MITYTIGYGGRKPQEFVSLLKDRNIRAVVDVRLRPDRSSMGIYVKAKDPKKGIQNLLDGADIEYFSFVELGNVFLGMDDWPQRYRRLMEQAGDLLIQRLQQVPTPFSTPLCLMSDGGEAPR